VSDSDRGDLFPPLSGLFGRTIRYENVPLELAESQFGSDPAALARSFNRKAVAAESDTAVRRLGVDLASVRDFLGAELAPTSTSAAERS
jgi:hypothetical protein